jgi:hypothetical protein
MGVDRRRLATQELDLVDQDAGSGGQVPQAGVIELLFIAEPEHNPANGSLQLSRQNGFRHINMIRGQRSRWGPAG